MSTYRVTIDRTDAPGADALLFVWTDVGFSQMGQGPEYAAVRALQQMLKSGPLGECEIDIRVRRVE